MSNSYIMKISKYTLAFILFFFPLNIIADDMSANEKTYQPSAEAMILDGLIYRPITLAGTVIGAGIYIVTLPFSLMGGNAGQAGQTLVMEPARMTFNRCLGCLPDYYHGQYHY